MNPPTHSDGASRYGRRDALKIGGLTVSVAALVAACGDGRTGDEAPGRVGYAPPVTDPPDYPIDNAVLLRTASSLELTLVTIYESFLEIGVLDDEQSLLIEEFIESHLAIAAEMGELTEAIDGVPWECTNPWYMNRLVDPLLVAIQGSDNPERDILNSVASLENIAAATHQTLTIDLTDPDASAATIAAATLESRHAAAIIAARARPGGLRQPDDRRGRRAERRRWHSVPVLDHRHVRFDRADRTRRRSAQRERRPRDVRPADAVVERPDLQRARTHLLIWLHSTPQW